MGELGSEWIWNDNLGREVGIARADSTATTASYNSASQSWSLSQNLAGTSQDVTYGMDYSPAAQLTQRSYSGTGASSYEYRNTANTTANYCPNGLNQYAAVGLPPEWASALGIAAIALIRLASIRWTITLPVLRLPDRD
jgi:hypothetical protein